VAGYGTVQTDEVPRTLARLVYHSRLVAVAGSFDQRGARWNRSASSDVPRCRRQTREAFAAHAVWARGRVAGLLRASLLPGGIWHEQFDDVVEDLRACLDWLAPKPTGQAGACELAYSLATLLFRAGRAREAQGRYEQAAVLADKSAKNAAEYPAQAAAVAKCRVLGEEALPLELAAIEAARANGDPTALAHALARAAETIFRFEACSPAPYRSRPRPNCSRRSANSRPTHCCTALHQ
jgi:tetratricopeptide (TPR) repeat protein